MTIKKKYTDKKEEEYVKLYGKEPTFSELEQFMKNRVKHTMGFDNGELVKRIGKTPLRFDNSFCRKKK